jgi:hypothetical protein
MERAATSADLKCLNCGAKLGIGASIVEFECEDCGVFQIAERDGGVAALRLLTDKADRIQDTVGRAAAELALNRVGDELGELEAKFNDLAESHTARKEMINKLFLGIFFVICISGFVMSSYASTVVPAVLFGIAGGLGLLLIGKRIVSKMDADFEERAKVLIEKGAGIKKRTIEYGKIVNS